MMLKNKIILVTGASRGIGRAVSELLAENGSEVIINYYNSVDKAKSLIETFKEKGLKAHSIRANVSNEVEVKQMFKEIRSKYGRLDCLVNNAGILKNNLLLMTSMNEFNNIMDVNSKGTFLCLQYAAKIMQRNKYGKIINIASIVGTNGNAGQVAYASSKSSVVGITKSAAKELGAYGITVNAIAPGLIDTDMILDLREEFKQKLLSNVSLGRIGTPLDVARVVLFLCSDMSDYVSGQIIGVDGCQVM